MDSTEVNQTKISVKHVATAIVGLVFIVFASQIPQPTSSSTVIPPGGIAFGPETFIRSTDKPATIIRNFSVANPDANYFIQIQNGENSTNRVSSAIIKLNDQTIVPPNEFNQNVPGLSKGIVLQQTNTLEVELRSMPNSRLTVTIRREMINTTIQNKRNDLVGNNNLESIGLVWDREEGAVEYVIFRSDFISGPFVEIGRAPTGLDRRTNAEDITADARKKTLCYKVEARDIAGKTIRTYEPVCVSSHVANPHELDDLSKRISPETFCLNEQQLTDTSTMSLSDIGVFLQKWDSFLIRQDKDVDGVPIDPATIIASSSASFGINPQAILGTLERESAAITRTSPPPETTLRLIMGFDLAHPTTIRQQIQDGTAQYRRDFDRLTGGEPTAGGWQLGISKTTLDGVAVVPRTKVSAGMFSYDPEVGIGWGGNTGAGGNFFLCRRWASFNFPIPPQAVTLDQPADVTATSLKLSWALPAFPDPDFLHYKIFRSTSPNVTENDTLVATITNQSQTVLANTGLTPNTTFFYRVFAVDQDNLSTGSNEVSAKTSLAVGLANTPWPMLRHDMQHSGKSVFVGIDTPVSKWFLNLPDFVFFELAIGNEGVLFGKTRSDQLLAINPDGTLKWQLQLEPSPIFTLGSTPAIAADGAIIIGAKKIYAVNPDGSIRWSFESPADEFSRSSPAIGSDGTIYIASTNLSVAKLFAINPDGTLKWQQPVGFLSFDSPAVANDGTIYIRARGSSSAFDAQLLAFNSDGSLRWSFLLPDGESNPLVAQDDTVYHIGYDNFLYAISSNGNLKWKQRISPGSTSVFSKIGLDNDSNVYVGAHREGKIVSYNSSGNLRWTLSIGFPVNCIGVMDASETLYIGTNSHGGVFAVTKDGTIKWHFVSPDNPLDIVGCPILDQNRTLYVATNSPTRVYAITQ
ncbi:MAG: PQQ-binding-like beta-propeller repeat protein [Parcubacteria group bacterium]|nr:PQQ-binding-like beta-propeller repeat protein [Parcubacteria group bacterium]